MGRPKNAELVSRNRGIIDMLAEGHRAEDVAETFGMSVSNVYRIREEYDADAPPGAHREILRGHLEYALYGTIIPMLKGPGRQVVTPRGPEYEMIPDPDTGKMMQDLTRPLYDEYAKLEAVDRLIKTSESLRRLSALDKDKPKVTVADDAGYQEMLDWVSSLTEEIKQVRAQSGRDKLRLAELEGDVVDAEVVE